MSALRYIKITVKNHTFIVFSYSKSALHALLSKWDHPTVHKKVIFCRLPSHMGIAGNERPDNVAKAALGKYVSECFY